MDDLSQKIGEILGDPQMMEQIKGLTGLFGQGGGSHQESSSPPDVSASSQAPSFPMNHADPNMIGMMMKLAPLLRSFQGEDDSTRLLRALRPFMHENRSKRIDGAIRLLQIMRALPLLKSAGIELLLK